MDPDPNRCIVGNLVRGGFLVVQIVGSYEVPVFSGEGSLYGKTIKFGKKGSGPSNNHSFPPLISDSEKRGRGGGILYVYTPALFT